MQRRVRIAKQYEVTFSLNYHTPIALAPSLPNHVKSLRFEALREALV